MLPIRKILCPTDFSSYSKYSFELATALARDYGAKLVVLHVAVPPITVYGEGIVPPEPPRRLEDLRARMESMHNLPAPGGLEYMLVEGDPSEEILHASEKMESDLIVMGTHGRTGMRRLLMGSVAEEVVRKANCPVFTVRTPMLESDPLLNPIAKRRAPVAV